MTPSMTAHFSPDRFYAQIEDETKAGDPEIHIGCLDSHGNLVTMQFSERRSLLRLRQEVDKALAALPEAPNGR